MRMLFALIASFVVLAANPALAQRTDVKLELLRVHVTLNADLTGEKLYEGITAVLSPAGIDAAGQSRFTVHPDTGRVEVVVAEVIQPDGTVVPVPAENIVTRPSAVAQRSQGFDRTMTTTLVFPKVTVGSRVRYVVRETITRAPVVGYNYFRTPSFNLPTDLIDYRLVVPADLPLKVAATDGLPFEDSVADGRRTISWRVEGSGNLTDEPGMPDVTDILPVFAVTSLSGWEELGRLYRSQSLEQAAVTPEIAEKARAIVGDRTGEAAARAIYNWVATNIRYVQVYLNHDAGYVPNPAAEVLRRRYGDCKDYVVLMQAMLAAVGIAADPVLVGWGGFSRELPVPNAFQFNHAMIHLPEFGIWANPTDQRSPMGTMDPGLAGQFVVVAAETPWTARLPAPGPEANGYSQRQRFVLNPDGSIAGEGTYRFKGAWDVGIRSSLLRGEPTREKADDMLRRTSEGGFGDFTHGDPLDLDTPTRIDATWESPQIVRMEDRILLPVPQGLSFSGLDGLYGLLTRGTRDFPMRSFPSVLSFDTEIVLPDGYEVGPLPPSFVEDGPLGSYRVTYRTQPGRVLVGRELRLIAHLVPASAYDAVIRLARVSRQDFRSVIELIRKPPA